MKKPSSVAGTTNESFEKVYDFSGRYPVVKIESGVWIKNTHIETLKDIKIHSTEHNLSEITLTFFAKVEGLDFPSETIAKSSQLLEE